MYGIFNRPGHAHQRQQSSCPIFPGGFRPPEVRLVGQADVIDRHEHVSEVDEAGSRP